MQMLLAEGFLEDLKLTGLTFHKIGELPFQERVISSSFEKVFINHLWVELPRSDFRKVA